MTSLSMPSWQKDLFYLNRARKNYLETVYLGSIGYQNVKWGQILEEVIRVQAR